MDLEKLLRSVPITRNNTLLHFTIALLAMGPVYAGIEVLLTEHSFDIDSIAIAVVVSGFGFFVVVLLRKFVLPPKRAALALKKADYMYECVSKLSRTQQDEIKSDVQNKLGQVWKSKTYLLARVPIPAVLGKHCLYGKVAVRETFGANQHVILPYQNIKEIILNKPDSCETVDSTVNEDSAASGVLPVVANIGGAFVFSEKRPTVVVIDDAANAYQIDCADADAFVEKLRAHVEDALVSCK